MLIILYLWWVFNKIETKMKIKRNKTWSLGLESRVNGRGLKTAITRNNQQETQKRKSHRDYCNGYWVASDLSLRIDHTRVGLFPLWPLAHLSAHPNSMVSQFHHFWRLWLLPVRPFTSIFLLLFSLLSQIWFSDEFLFLSCFC